MSDDNPATTLSALIDSLEVVEKALEPLQAQEWSSTLEGLSMLERAKMDVLASYTIHDLIWVYLKLKGVDPENHDVSAELERIKTYYAKVKAVEEPEAPRPQIDSAAAKRFITSSIPKSQHLTPNSTANADLPASSAAQLAASQAASALQGDEEEEASTLRRLGKAGRFRFIEKEGTGEKIIPGSGSATNDAGEEQNLAAEEEEEEEDEEEDEEVGNASGMTEEAEEFLRGIEEEMKVTRRR
ncbi:hypothetical protein IAU59_006449 [Kwoniella sp. CBS 9459]